MVMEKEALLCVTSRTVNCQYLPKLQMNIISDPIYLHMGFQGALAVKKTHLITQET